MKRTPDDHASKPITVAGEAMQLDPEGALIWTAHGVGFVADTHFGKAAAFRRAGFAVPTGATDDDLARLTGVINRHGLTHLVVLGDFFHAPPVSGEPFIDAFTRWRRHNKPLTLTVIRGNHDRPTEDALASLIDWQPEGLSWPPFRLYHFPSRATHAHVLAGHEHPAIQLASSGDRLRAPAFRLLPGLTILPAFGGLTGGYVTPPETGEQRIAVTPAGLFDLP